MPGNDHEPKNAGRQQWGVEPVQKEKENDALEREVNATLATYAAVEPRVGLEERVLANLRAERERARAWWRWPALGALAAVAVFTLAVSLLWRSQTPSVTAHPPAPTGRSDRGTGTRIAAKNGDGVNHPMVRSAMKRPARHGAPQPAVVAQGPKLDRFPSPQPLSEQEQLLVRYVKEFPQDAVMIAKAQAEFEKEFEKPSGVDPPGTKPDQQ